MPNSKTGISKLKVIKYVLFTIVLAVLSSLSFYLSKYSNKMDRSKWAGQHYYKNNGEIILAAYPIDIELPEFVMRDIRLGVPPELDLDYDRIEQIAIKVTSTGNFDIKKMPLNNNNKDTIEVYELEVFVEDNNYLEENGFFKVAMQVKVGPNFEIEVNPRWFHDILKRRKIDKLIKEVDAEGVAKDEYLGERIEQTTQSVDLKIINREEIKELFKAGTKFTIVPHQEILIDKEKDMDKKTRSGYYSYILDQYYEGEDSDILDEIIINKSLKNVKSPVFATSIYLTGQN